jgi:glycosyltransferase Alg8
LAILVGVGYLLLKVVGDASFWALHRLEVLATIAGIGCWRWGWFVLQNVRAVIYRYWKFPRIRRQAEQAVAVRGPVPEVTIMATTYREKPWITRPVFLAILRELEALEGLVRRPRLVVATGCDEDDATIKAIHAEYCQKPSEQPLACWPPELVLLRADNGKRPAIAAALKEIARENPMDDGVVVFLDGDTIMQPGLLQKILPIFRLTPPVDAVTTNEDGFVKGPGWFAEWVSLRFGLRHRTMCSVSLSGKLLCLTGRLSAFRASVATDPSFQAQIEHDTINNWLWGSFEMLSGDDKSTWYWLARNGRRMLYVPDALATTLEVVASAPVRRALANIRRWSGNSLRHSWRTIRLGPRRVGFFPWWSLLDQRIAMFTVLFGPLACLLALGAGRYEIAAGYALWLLCSRLAHAAIAWRHGRRWSAFYVPLVFLSDWATALTKMWVLFHPAKQNWLNRGARTLDSTQSSKHYQLQRGLAHYLYVFTCSAVAIGVGLLLGFLPLLTEAPLFMGRTVAAAPTPAIAVAAQPNRVMFGGPSSPMELRSASSRMRPVDLPAGSLVAVRSPAN